MQCVSSTPTALPLTPHPYPEGALLSPGTIRNLTADLSFSRSPTVFKNCMLCLECLANVVDGAFFKKFPKGVREGRLSLSQSEKVLNCFPVLRNRKKTRLLVRIEPVCVERLQNGLRSISWGNISIISRKGAEEKVLLEGQSAIEEGIVQMKLWCRLGTDGKVKVGNRIIDVSSWPSVSVANGLNTVYVNTIFVANCLLRLTRVAKWSANGLLKGKNTAIDEA